MQIPISPASERKVLVDSSDIMFYLRELIFHIKGTFYFIHRMGMVAINCHKYERKPRFYSFFVYEVSQRVRYSWWRVFSDYQQWEVRHMVELLHWYIWTRKIRNEQPEPAISGEAMQNNFPQVHLWGFLIWTWKKEALRIEGEANAMGVIIQCVILETVIKRRYK